MSIADDKARYKRAAHGMQTGVAWEMLNQPLSAATSPKHLRVGINSAMADQEGLVRLLIAKGIITEEEYTTAMADAMERERGRYQARMPPNVTLA